MGSLIAWGAVGGAGKGLTAVGAEKQRQLGEEKRDARQVQLQRQRDSAAMERQREADRAASARAEQEWGPGGYREHFETIKADIEETAAGKKHQYALELEEARQRGEMAMEQHRLTEKEPRFESTHVPAETRMDMATQQWITTKAEDFVTDKISQLTFTARPGGIFVVRDHETPTRRKIEAGMKAYDAGMLEGDTQKQRNDRYWLFLNSWGFIPGEYFSQHARPGLLKRTEEQVRQTTTQ